MIRHFNWQWTDDKMITSWVIADSEIIRGEHRSMTDRYTHREECNGIVKHSFKQHNWMNENLERYRRQKEMYGVHWKERFDLSQVCMISMSIALEPYESNQSKIHSPSAFTLCEKRPYVVCSACVVSAAALSLHMPSRSEDLHTKSYYIHKFGRGIRIEHRIMHTMHNAHIYARTCIAIERKHTWIEIRLMDFSLLHFPPCAFYSGDLLSRQCFVSFSILYIYINFFSTSKTPMHIREWRYRERISPNYTRLMCPFRRQRPKNIQ